MSNKKVGGEQKRMEKTIEVKKNMHRTFILRSDAIIHIVYERGERIGKDQLRIGEQFRMEVEGEEEETSFLKGQVAFVITGKSKDLRMYLRLINNGEITPFLSLGEEIITVIGYTIFDIIIPEEASFK